MYSRFSLFGVEINRMGPKDAIEFLLGYDFSRTGYICLSDTYTIAKAEENPVLKNILNQSILTLPDGKPIELYARLKGYREVSTVSGYWLLRALLKPGIRHYFYGADTSTLQQMSDSFKNEFPAAEILGYKSPPILASEEIPDNAVIATDFAEINRLGPDIVWIGISSPKQDFLMAHHQERLEHGIMIGIGGVFNYVAGNQKISPEWIKEIGMRWLYRLIQEPGRLWRKYLFAISRFFMLFAREIYNRHLSRKN